jgi:tetratricopeptide (TPR) repeat protein
VHAGSSARFEQSYRSIANAVKLPGADEPKIDMLDLVFRWLENDDSGTWLMIVDNADDSAVFFPRVPTSMTQISDQLGRAAVLSTYLPKRSGGSILITSRNRDAAFQLVGRLDRIIKVKQFEEVDAKTLLRKKLPNDPSDEGDWNTLIDALECLPLAITQAAAYIAMRSPRMTVAKYLKYFRRSELNQISLLSENRADLRRDPEIPNAVVMTWQISFDQIRLQYPSAADLLARMSILDRQGIPKFLVCHHKHEDEDEDEEDEEDDDGDDDDDLEFEDAIGTLIGFSFVNSQEDGDNFEMHPLVQLSTRKWLEIHGEIEQRKEEVLSLLSQKFPTGEHANWTICEALEPHAQIVLRYQSVSQGCRLKRANILHNSAWFAVERGSYMVARGRIQEAVRIREELLGPNNQDTLASCGLLAWTMWNQGLWKEAEELNVKVMGTELEVLGEEHPDTLISMANLASTYRIQGRWKEAEELNMKVIETSLKVLGEEHPDTLVSMANLASTYRNQGRWKEAEKLFVKVIETSLKVLGEEHPSTLTRMANLASTYRNQGRWKEAEKLLVKVIETSLKVLGEEYPSTLTSIANLALTMWNQGRWKEAEELEVKVMETRLKVLGKEHPSTLTSMANLASTMWNQGRWKEAEELNVKVMETSLKVLGEEHPSTLTRMANLAYTWKSQGRDEEAIELMKRAVGLKKQVLGSDHYSTINSTQTLYAWQMPSETESAKDGVP